MYLCFKKCLLKKKYSSNFNSFIIKIHIKQFVLVITNESSSNSFITILVRHKVRFLCDKMGRSKLRRFSRRWDYFDISASTRLSKKKCFHKMYTYYVPSFEGRKKSNQSTKKISLWCYFFIFFPDFIFLIVEILIRIGKKILYKKGKLHEKIGQW